MVKVSMVKSAKHDRRAWWPAFLLAAIGVLALLVVPQARSVDTSATPSTVQPGPVDKPALRAIIEEETRQRARAPRADKAALRAARDAQAATAPAPAAAPARRPASSTTSKVRCRPRPTGC